MIPPALLVDALSSTPTLSSHLDEDASQYILSILVDDPSDEDAREAVMAFILSSMDTDRGTAACAAFFEALDGRLSSDPSSSNCREQQHSKRSMDDELPRRLESAITLKSHDERLSSSSDMPSSPVNLVPVADSSRATSERERRKTRQKELRAALEDQERRRAIQEAMRMLEEEQSQGNRMDADGASLSAGMRENAVDVQFHKFHLPNCKGGGPDLLTDASLTLARGRRYGLMGRNGCGKTTLLSALAARTLDAGTGCGIPMNMSMLLVRQEIIGDNFSAVETVLKCDIKREGIKQWVQYLESELKKLENPHSLEEEDRIRGKEVPIESKRKQKLKDRKKTNAEAFPISRNSMQSDHSSSSNYNQSIEEKQKNLSIKLTHAYDRLARVEQEDGGDPEFRARMVLFGLGFTTPEMQNKPTKELSGGWRMRVSLSCALFANPSLLLLDADESSRFGSCVMAGAIPHNQFKGTLVVVSHDRHFLNEVVTDVLHFHQGKLTTYRGDISNFIAVREENRKRQVRLYEQQEAKRAHLQKYIDLHAQAGENGVKAAKQRKSRMKKLDKLGIMAQEGRRFKASYDGEAEEVEEYVEDDDVCINFPDPGAFNGDIVRLELVSFGYTPETILLKNIDLTVDMSSRVALLGRNGCGKSTLIKIIVGALQVNRGKVFTNSRAKIEYLAQHQFEQLDLDGTPIEAMLERYPGDGGNSHKMELRRYLANFGLGGNELPLQKIHTMSGGQKCRLCLAAAMYRRPHLLILDEPTNHLDLETTEALISAIKKFAGGVLLVSHDQHLLTSVCKDLYVVDKRGVELLREGTTNEASFEKYKKDVIQGRR